VTAWYEDRANVARLIVWAATEKWDPSELGRIVEKPWNYTDEYEEMGS